MTFSFYDALKEQKESPVTGKDLFHKVMEVMRADPTIAEEMGKLDYALPSNESGAPIEEDAEIITYLDPGCEGCYLNIFLVNRKKGSSLGIGTLKTLEESLMAWRAMGTLSGEFSYLADIYLSENIR